MGAFRVRTVEVRFAGLQFGAIIMKLYVIGSMRNERVQDVSQHLRSSGFEVFDDWHSSGPESDVFWQKYEEARGRSYIDALGGLYARHVFEFDLDHLKKCDAAVLVTPCGRSAYLELGWMLGQGKPGFILLEEELDRWDVMLQFATSVVGNTDDLISAIEREIHRLEATR